MIEKKTTFNNPLHTHAEFEKHKQELMQERGVGEDKLVCHGTQTASIPGEDGAFSYELVSVWEVK